MEKASLRALDLLTIRADERAGEQLIKDWVAACEAWAQHGNGDEGHLGNGAKMLGELQALIGATKGVLPEKYCRMGHLNGLMRWAGLYARMQQDGTLPRHGLMKGPIYQKFVEAMQKRDEVNKLQGMSEEDAKEALALIADERLEVAMMKVATECRRRLELFLKDRERERIDTMVERAYPKRQEGKKSPRGKMATEAYKRMEAAYRYMNMEQNALAELIDELKQKLNNLDTMAEDYEQKEAELEDELFLASTFGCWENMSFEQAKRAAGAMAELIGTGRNAWQHKLRAEKRRAAYKRAQITRNFKTKLEDVQRTRGKKDAKEKARKLTIAKNLAMGTMSYSQLMLALEPVLGKEFVGEQMRQISRAHEDIAVFNQEMHRWLYNTLRDITGLQTEGEIEEWINANNTIMDTGIDRLLSTKETAIVPYDEALAWVAMTPDARKRERARLTAEAEARGEKPDNIPDEDAIEELAEKLSASEKNGTKPKEYTVTVQHQYTSRLHATKEAMLYAILTFEQDVYTHLREANGLTEEDVQKMRELVGEELGLDRLDVDFIAEEMQKIKDKALANGTFMKAPNGKPTELTERQWLQVRTKTFKKWFGDWERVALFRAARDAIMQMQPIINLTGTEFQKDETPITDKVPAYWQDAYNGKVESPELGWVALDREGVKSSLGHGLGALKAAAFYAVPEVIKNGRIFDRQTNWKNSGYDTVVLAAPITIAGVEYICEVVVEQRSNRQGFYLHEVGLKKKLGSVFKTSTKGGTHQASGSMLAQRNAEVNTLWENCSKAVDGRKRRAAGDVPPNRGRFHGV